MPPSNPVSISSRRRRDSLLEMDETLEETVRPTASYVKDSTVPPLSATSVVSQTSTTSSRTSDAVGRLAPRPHRRQRSLSATASPAEVCALEIESRWQVHASSGHGGTEPKSALESGREYDGLRAHLHALAGKNGRPRVLSNCEPATSISSRESVPRRQTPEADLLRLIPPPLLSRSSCREFKPRRTTSLLRTPTQYHMSSHEQIPNVVADGGYRYGSGTRFGGSSASLASFKSDQDNVCEIEARVGTSVKTFNTAVDVKPPWWRPNRGWPGRSRKSHSIANMESIRNGGEPLVDEEAEEVEETYIGMDDM